MTQGEHMLNSRLSIRSKYWSQFINHEESVLAGLRWYIIVVFDHEGLFCDRLLFVELLDIHSNFTTNYSTFQFILS